VGYRHGRRERRLAGTFDTTRVTVPRARVADQARAGIGQRVTYDHTERLHSAAGGRTPREAHDDTEEGKLAA